MEFRSMKRLLTALALLMCFSSVPSTLASTAGQNRNLDFTLVNKTGLTIQELYISTTKDDKWGEDVLGQDVLKDGARVDIKFSPKETSCRWDLKIVDEDDDDVEWEDFNLCEASEITLLYEKGKPTALIK
jgi:hypothetical protein